MMEALSYHGLEIIKAADHEPPMNKVKRLVEQPLLLAVFALECHVRRCSLAWLDETNVCPYNVCVWMLSSEFDGPYSRAGTDIKNMDGMDYWRQVKFAFQDMLPRGML